MANEIRGILYENITQIALDLAIQTDGIEGQVHWNETPANISVVPDFTIGKDKDHPTHVILVTASGSAKESEKKSWRNLGEMQEMKAQLPSPPTVINLYFKSELKEGISVVTDKLYDAILHIERCAYYRPLEAWVTANLTNAAKTRDMRRQLLINDMAANPNLANAIAALADDLALALDQRKADLDSLWELMRADYLRPHHPPIARDTSVRRGIGKLMVLEASLRQDVYTYHGKLARIPLNKVPEYGYTLGFFNKEVGGARLIDLEIMGAIDLLGSQVCEDVIAQVPSAMSIWYNPLRDLARVAVHVDFIRDHYAECTDPVQLEKLIITCFNDPAGLSGVPGDEKVWVYETLISLLKAQSGKLQGYGVAQLAQDTGVRSFGDSGLVLPPFVQRTKMLSQAHITALAEGLARRFKQNVSPTQIDSVKSQVATWVIKENLEDRLIPYRNFEPMLWLLLAELRKQGKHHGPKLPYAGWTNEYAGIGRKVGTTPCVQVGKTLIHWKSVSDAGKVHKKKELSARARNLRYQYDPQTLVFSKKPDIERLVLIVDGTFNDSDLRVLSEAGWDEIVYPDRIADLVSRL